MITEKALRGLSGGTARTVTRRRAGRGLDTITEPSEGNAHDLAQGWVAHLEESGSDLLEAVGRDALLENLKKWLIEGCSEAELQRLTSNYSHTDLESPAP
jgi:hypothetical protein